MAIELLTESNLVSATGRDPVGVGVLGGRVRFARSATVTTGTTTTSGSTYLAMRLPSHARLLYVSLEGDGTIDLPDVDVGVRQVNGDNTLDDDALATALDIDDTGAHAAITMFSPGSQDITKQMWEWAGLSEDPGGEFDIHVSLDADAVAAGTFYTTVLYVVD